MIGSGELIVILCLGLLLFGGKKLPEFARNLGKGIREFKKACNGEEEVETPPPHLDKIPSQIDKSPAQTSDNSNAHPPL